MFVGLYPSRGQPAETPWRLALVLVMQFADGLPDRQAAEAVRSRIDWKYLLGLELTDPGFDSTVLSEFRTRLVESSAERRLLDAILELCRARKWHFLGWLQGASHGELRGRPASPDHPRGDHRRTGG
jgi:transposase